MALEKVQLDHAPPDRDIYVALFRDVSASSTEAIQKELLARNPAFEYALIDATSIISCVHLLSAVFNGINGASTGSLITTNVHSEIVLSLGPNNNVRHFCAIPPVLQVPQPCLLPLTRPQNRSQTLTEDGASKQEKPQT